MKITVKIGRVEISAVYDEDYLPMFSNLSEPEPEPKDLLIERVEAVKEKAINAYQRTFMVGSIQE